MGFLERLFGGLSTPGADNVRILDIPTGNNVRELGYFDTPAGPTQPHRYLRSGSTRALSLRDIERLERYGVTHVLDLRGLSESPELTDAFARRRTISWRNVEFYGRDISDRTLIDAAADKRGYLTGSYLTMLSNHDGVRRIFAFLAQVPAGECLLFHCAAGMDRTGMCSMLILGLLDVSRADIIKDYLYSFGTVDRVDRAVATGSLSLAGMRSGLLLRHETISQTYDSVVACYGSVRGFLEACGVPAADLEAVRAHLLEP